MIVDIDLKALENIKDGDVVVMRGHKAVTISKDELLKELSSKVKSVELADAERARQYEILNEKVEFIKDTFNEVIGILGGVVK
ncbi:MAG TPA: hypothetical protein PK557_02935 [Paludibacteraceae bacterium]|nr:hypothetical protein [Paludibacteraceae bacterium]